VITEACYSIPESFEYFCQMSSKSILIISSYTIPKLMRFLRHTFSQDKEFKPVLIVRGVNCTVIAVLLL